MDYRNSAPDEASDARSAKTLASQSSSLEAKFMELEELLENKSWMEQYPTSDDEDTLVTDVDRRDESHLLMLQKELQEAEVNLVDREAIHKAVATMEQGNDKRDDVLEENGRVESDIRMGGEEMFKEKFEALEENLSDDDFGRDGRNYNRDRCVRFAQEVTEIECDLDGPILPQESFSGTTSEAEDYRGFLSSPYSHTLGAAEEDRQYYSIYAELEATLGDKDAPFLSSEYPSDESRHSDFAENESGGSIPFQFTNTTIRPNSQWETFSPLSHYQHYPYEDMFEQSFEPSIDLDQVVDPWQFEMTNENVFSNPFFLDSSTGNDCLAKTQEDGMHERTDSANSFVLEEETISWREYIPSWKSPLVVGSLFCILQIFIHVVLLKGFLSLLLNNHSMDFTDTSLLPSHLCDSDVGCRNAIPLLFDESGEKEVIGNTEGLLFISEKSESPCSFEPQSPAQWYSLIGNGKTLSASISSDADDFSAIFTVFVGRCDAVEGIHGPSECCGSPDRPQSLTWDTTEGKRYSIAVYSDAVNSTGSFNLNIWDSRYTTMLLSQHTERQNRNDIPSWAIGWSFGIAFLFALFSVIS